MDNKNGIELAYNDEGDVQISRENLEKVLAVVLMMTKDHKNLNQEQEDLVAFYASGILYMLFEAKKDLQEFKEKGEGTVYSADSKYGLS